jgi:hypothetical protein
VKSKVYFRPKWLFSTMHNDGNLPSTVLQRYHVVLDYPAGTVTIAEPGILRPRGERVAAAVNPATGIIQIDAVIGTDSMSFAIDNGASYSFASVILVDSLLRKYSGWSRVNGALGCANIWGWWPQEEAWQVVRVPEIRCGTVLFGGVGMVGLPDFLGGGLPLGLWYSRKSARPVEGFLGPNALQPFRVELDYTHGAIYFERHAENDLNDMCLVGLTLRPEPDSSYSVIGISSNDGKLTVEGVQAGDKLLMVGDFRTTGATMGSVIDTLRGRPGERRALLLEREGRQFHVEARVQRFL